MLAKARNICKIINSQTTYDNPFVVLRELFSDFVDSNIFVVNLTGEVVDNMFETNHSMWIDISRFESKPETTSLHTRNRNTRFTKDKYQIEVPIICGDDEVGAVILSNNVNPFNLEDIVLAEFCGVVIGSKLYNLMELSKVEISRRNSIAEHAINSLSHTEKGALLLVLKHLTRNEGTIVISELASKTYMTRTVIVNTLRMLEGAGVIETRSLGTKGTFIRVLNENVRNVTVTEGLA